MNRRCIAGETSPCTFNIKSCARVSSLALVAAALGALACSSAGGDQGTPAGAAGGPAIIPGAGGGSLGGAGTPGSVNTGPTGPGPAAGTGGSTGVGPAGVGGAPPGGGTAPGGLPQGGVPSVGGAPPGGGGVAGSPPAGTAGAAGAPAGAAGAPTAGCGLNTGYLGDDQCIQPPPPDKGFQLHVGPSSYTNPEAIYVLQPGQEATTDFPLTSSNDKDIYFFYRQYRVRPTTHHAIITASNSAVDIASGARIGTANRSEDYPVNGVIAPEDQGVGLPLKAHSAIDVSFHTINTAPDPQLRELWVNFWYKDASTVTQPAKEWFNIGSASFAVPPHSQQTLGPYSCTVQGDGRLLWLYGHRHANNTRFTVTRVRGAQRDVIYDADNWEEPLLLDYSSIVTNPAPDIANGVEGGWSGILDLKSGDRIEWSCDVNNTHDSTLMFTNQTYLGEMCIVDAEAVGSTCLGL